MDLADSTSRSFVVRIWIEETTAEAGRVTWRGHVTDVLRDDRRHVASLAEITDIIAPCLTQMGVRFGRAWRLGYWLRQRRARSGRRRGPAPNAESDEREAATEPSPRPERAT